MTSLFEYRVFLPLLPSAITDKIAITDCSKELQSRETYILSRQVDGYNVKIRGGRLEIKVLIDRVRGLERWRPLATFDFPITRTLLNDEVLNRLDVTGPALLHDAYSESRLLYQLVVPSNELEQSKVVKRRRKLRIDDCAAEIVDLTIDDFWHCKSFAVEGENPDRLLALTNDLNIAELSNQNYPALIKQLTGMVAPAA